MSDETEEKDMELIEKHVEQIGEHFDTVQIFATRHDGDGTVSVSIGGGNWFARVGQVSEWLVKTNERSAEIVRKEENEE